MKWLWLTVGTKTLAAIVLGSIHWSDKWCDVGRTKTKRQRLAELIEQQNLYISCLYIETHFISMDTYRLKVRGWTNVFQANGNQKKARIAILMSGKIDFKIKTVTRDK